MKIFHGIPSIYYRNKVLATWTSKQLKQYILKKKERRTTSFHSYQVIYPERQFYISQTVVS